MNMRLIPLLVAGLFLVPALAQAQADGMTWSGNVNIGVRGVSDSADDPSKLHEYRDLGNSTSVLGGFELKGRGANYYLNGFGENLGRDDMYLDLKGGKYSAFKYQLYYNSLRHEFGEGVGARTPFAGAGGNTLTAPSIAGGFPTNPATWNTFDHSYKRKDFGGMFELQTLAPWYFRAEANEVKRDGINVFAGSNGTSPGNGFTDLPSPIQYSTKNYTLEAGYSTKTAHFAANLLYSTFDNDNDVLRWSNRFLNPGAAGGALDTTMLPPDNNLWKLSLNGNIRQLPGHSTLAGRLTYSELTNNVDMLQSILSITGTGNTTTYPGTERLTSPSNSRFNGKLTTTTLGLSLTSHPLKELDTRVYWNYSDENNKSTRMSFNPVANTGATGAGLRGGAASGAGNNPAVNCDSGGLNPCTPEFFEYRKNNLGIEAVYKLNRGNKLSGGWDYYDIDRERFDFHGNRDNKLFVEWKNNSLDELTARIKYQYLNRRSEWSVSPGAIQANPIEPFVRRFDLANVNQNLIKAVADWSPIPFLDFGLEAIYKNNDYKDTLLGRTEDQRQELYASVGYGDSKVFRVFAFGDWEYTTYDSYHRVGTGNPNPATAPNTGTYNWDAKNRDKSWQYGIGADWAPMEKLKLSASYLYTKTRGSADFAVQPGGTTAAQPGITNFDNSVRNSLNFKATYDATRTWQFTGGYAYERYKYSDIGYDGTRYFLPSAASGASATSPAYAANLQSSVVTGQYSFQPYKANIFYLIAKYKFN